MYVRVCAYVFAFVDVKLESREWNVGKENNKYQNKNLLKKTVLFREIPQVQLCCSHVFTICRALQKKYHHILFMKCGFNKTNT